MTLRALLRNEYDHAHIVEILYMDKRTADRITDWAKFLGLLVETQLYSDGYGLYCEQMKGMSR